ncbi:MAG: ketopantoate reductase family protein [Promethearchaeota archaeon]
MEFKTIWICGIGGVGGYFGGKIAHHITKLGSNDHKIYFLARGPHLKEIKKNGLILHTSKGEELICTPTLATDNILELPSPDLCVICVKSYDLDDLILSIEAKLRDDTIIIPLMNGFDIYERIRKNLVKCIVLPTCVYVGSYIDKPGVVIQSGNAGFFCSGPDPKYPIYNPQSIIKFFNNMEIELKWKENPHPAIWEKYLLVASFALVCTYTGQTLGGVINDNISNKMLRDVMSEIISISKKIGISLPENIIDNIIEFCSDYPDIKPSYMRDVEKGGKNEGDLFGGAIIRMGKEHNIPTPVTSSVYKN